MIDSFPVIGIDPALRHGAIVYSPFERKVSGGWVVIPQVIYTWTVEDEISLSQKSDATAIFRLINKIVNEVQETSTRATPITIDWDSGSGLWGARRRQIAVQAFFIGGLASALHRWGYVVHFIEPWAVRCATNLNGQASKEAIWTALQTVCQVDLPDDLEDPEYDIRDCLSLGYTLLLYSQGDLT